ncbi:MAG TPA: HAMP domain-containing sensor histidine kinase, partial [Bacillota bacterium]|nr:HAMP domain-containing sensor histidine kinase [Bacillota bacterium]
VAELEHLSYSITHDMRAPLRAIQSFGGILQEEAGHCLNEETQGYLTRMRTAANRMDALIRDVFNYSKLVREELALQPTDVSQLVRGIVETYPMFHPPKAQVEVDPNLPLVLGNEAALTQCFSNLIDNAVKFVKPGQTPKVRVSGELKDGFVRIYVTDNGIGIPKDLQSKIFGMFQRLSSSTEGTGVGLAIVRKATERMGGRVGLESESGQGSRFWIDLKPAPPPAS